MSDLIAKTRSLIGDIASGSEVFSDQDIQNVLDVNRELVNYITTRAEPYFQPGGDAIWQNYYAEPIDEGSWSTVYGLRWMNSFALGAGYGTPGKINPIGDWEAFGSKEGIHDGLYDSSWNPLTPDYSDYLTGHWSFTAGQAPPVRLVGKTYDVYAAAAELLEKWASKRKLEYSFSADGMTAHKRELIENILRMADEYRAKRRLQNVTMIRGDANAGAGFWRP